MVRLKYILFFIHFLACLWKVSAQTNNNVVSLSLKGKVSSAIDQEPLSGATVQLQTTDYTPIKTISTSNEGEFEFRVNPNTNYFIIIDFVGFEQYISDTIQSKTQPLNLGAIELERESQLLEGVVISVAKKKPLIQSKSDRMIYNAGADISNKSGSAADVLRKAPMLSVDPDGSVKMRGNSNIKVLLNGMPSGIIATNLKDALKMIPASSIESVEVITSPSAKYEAEGAAGVINIITKKKLSGTNGSIDLSSGNLEHSGNLALNISTGKFSFAISANASLEKEKTNSVLNRSLLSNEEKVGSLYQERKSLNRDKGGYGSLTTEYRIDSLQKLEVGTSYWIGKWPEKSSLYNYSKLLSGESKYNQQSNQDGTFKYYDFSLNYQKKFRKEGQELQFIGQTSHSNDKSEYITDQFQMDGTHTFRESSPNKNKSKDWSLQADYAHPISKSGRSFVETGVRYLSNSSKSDYNVFNSLNTVDPSRSDIMSYTQNVFSFYTSVNLKTENDWGFRPGIRFEQTDLRGDFKSNNTVFSNSYNNWVPSFLITKTLNDQHEFKFNYAERIRRPWIWDLNPYVNASDPNNITSGNPELKPELTRTFELGHDFLSENGFSLNSSVYFNTNNNAIESITRVEANGVSYTTSQNIASNSRLGTNVNAFFKLNSRWTMNAGTEIFYLKFKSNSLNFYNDGWFYSINLNTTYKLPKDFNLLFSGEYANGYITLQSKNSANYSYRIAANKEILNKRAIITLSANNPFQRSFMQRSSTTAPTFQNNSENRFFNRSISLSFSWRFGSLKSSESSEKRFDGQDDDRGGRKR